jgi:hypothetical protein
LHLLASALVGRSVSGAFVTSPQAWHNELGMRASPARRLFRSVALIGAHLAAMTSGCGGRFEFTEKDGGDAGSAREAPSTDGVDGASPTSVDAATTSGDAAAGSDQGDASGRIPITFNYSPPSFIGVDCRPALSTDPVELNVNVVFENPAGVDPQSVTFPAARVEFSRGSKSLTWNFQVMTEPLTPSPPLPLVDESLWNLPSSGAHEGDGAPCDYCGESAVFDLEVSSPGQSPYWTSAVSPVECDP